jgi:hypothetical protein
MSDSTAAYFGATAAHTDTAGLDSALTYGLAHPRPAIAAGGSRFRIAPTWGSAAWTARSMAQAPRWAGRSRSGS